MHLNLLDLPLYRLGSDNCKYYAAADPGSGEANVWQSGLLADDLRRAPNLPDT